MDLGKSNTYKPHTGDVCELTRKALYQPHLCYCDRCGKPGCTEGKPWCDKCIAERERREAAQ